MTNPAQRHIVQWLLDNPGETVPLGSRLEDCELACALVNLRIARVAFDEDTGMANAITLRSAERAKQFLGA